MLYMSPEQRNGERNYDFKVDIYSMGLILFELYYPIGSEHERFKRFDQVCKGTYPEQFLKTYPKEVSCIFI